MRFQKHILNCLCIAVISINYSCSSDEGLEIRSIRDFNIYAEDTLNNVLAFDMVPTTQGFLIASVCGNSRMSNKFGGDGRLYLLEIDKSGNVLWEDICQKSLFQSGYPSNLISTAETDRFTLFWNEFNGNLKKITLTVGTSPDSLEIAAINCNGCRVDEAIFWNDKIYSVGISEGRNGPNTTINELNLILQTSRSLTEKSFDASRFGGFGLNDLNFVNRINNYIHIKSNGERLLYSGPSVNGMIFSHVGELIPEYLNTNFWIQDFIKNPESNESFSIVLQNPGILQGQSIFIPFVDLSGLPGQSDIAAQISASKFRFTSMDPDLPQYIIRYNSQQWVIIGTSINGIPSLVSIDIENNKITRSFVGNDNRMNIAKALLTENNELLISGTTVVNNRFQRPFLIRVANSDIF